MAQGYLYTGQVFNDGDELPGYEVLISLWIVGDDLKIDGLCDEALEAMEELRHASNHIPATPLLVEVWEKTPEGCSIRKLLLSWVAEYIRSSESRHEFSKTLPQKVLSELVVALSNEDSAQPMRRNSSDFPGAPAQHKIPHYLNDAGADDERKTKMPKHRHSDALPATSSAAGKKADPDRKISSRDSLPAPRPSKARKINLGIHGDDFTTDQKLNFCADLLTRMLSGPGTKDPFR